MSKRTKIMFGFEIPKTNSFLAIGIYLVISLCVLAYGLFNTAIDPYRGLLICILGMAVFSLIEYITHRFLYHSGKDYKNEKYWQYKIHGVHHIFPRDLKLLAMPIFLALLISGVLFYGIYILLGDLTYFFGRGLCWVMPYTFSFTMWFTLENHPKIFQNICGLTTPYITTSLKTELLG